MKKNVPPHKTIATGPASGLTLPKDVQRRIETGRMAATDIVDCAEGLKRRGDVEACVAAYQLWMRGSKDPNRHLGCFNLAVTLSSLGRSDEALEAYEQALATHPLFPEALLNIGLVFDFGLLLDLSTSPDFLRADFGAFLSSAMVTFFF